MIQKFIVRHPPIIPFRFVRHFESKNNFIRIFGPCEVTGKNFEIHVSVDGFFTYLQGFKNISDALASSTKEEQDFILTGISPEGRKAKEHG